MVTRLQRNAFMKNNRLRILRAAALLGLVFIIAANVPAQKKVRLNSTPKAFRDFYAKFVRTARKGDVKTLANFAHYPFHYGFDAGDEGYWKRSQFVKQFGDVLMPQPIVFKEKNPEFTVDKGTYTLLAEPDGASYYTFAKRGGSYKFISYLVEP